MTKPEQGFYVAVDLNHYISYCQSNDVPLSETESSQIGFLESWINQSLEIITDRYNGSMYIGYMYLVK